MAAPARSLPHANAHVVLDNDATTAVPAGPEEAAGGGNTRLELILGTGRDHECRSGLGVSLWKAKKQRSRPGFPRRLREDPRSLVRLGGGLLAAHDATGSKNAGARPRARRGVQVSVSGSDLRIEHGSLIGCRTPAVKTARAVLARRSHDSGNGFLPVSSGSASVGTPPSSTTGSTNSALPRTSTPSSPLSVSGRSMVISVTFAPSPSNVTRP